MNEVLLGEGRCKEGVNKKQVKDIFVSFYGSQLELVLRYGLDEKKLGVL
jgi:hypothetical protein